MTSKFHILQPTDKGCKTLHSQFFPSPDEATDVEISGNPAVANGRVYSSTSFETYCIGKKEHKATAQVPALAAEPRADPNAKPAHLQVVPAEVALYPGESATFKARAFDAHGRFLREVEAKWSLPAPPPPPKSDAKPPPLQGQIDAAGKLTVKQAPPPGQFGLVQAAAEGLTARARVRVVPPLPYRADFSKIPVGRTPGGWVNTQGKFVIVEKDSKHVLKKLANNASPLFARANAYMEMPNLTDYTIQADLQSAKKGDDVSDMGVVANRYILLLNNKQQLRIISWESTPQARVDKTIAFKWEPDHWYRMKLTVKVNGNKAVIRGKVWPRDQEEPKERTIEFEDATPNREGSPALYGYVNGITEEPGAEIFYDNVSVAPNEK